MTIGLSQPIVLRGQNHNRAKSLSDVWGLVVSRSFPDLDLVRETVTRLQTSRSRSSEIGTAKTLEAPVWACAETDIEARRILEDPVLLPLVPSWRLTGGDLRRLWRDTELLLLCDRVYVFQKTKSQWSTWRDRGVYDGLTVIESPTPAAVKRARSTR